MIEVCASLVACAALAAPTRIDPLKETLWRGSPDAGRDLVVFPSEKACSDQMSDVVHPVTARASFPDGRFFAGCCRVVAGTGPASGAVTGTPPFHGRAFRLESLPGTDRKACPDPIMKQERAFLAALESAVTWAVEGDSLDMHRADGQRALMASRR